MSDQPRKPVKHEKELKQLGLTVSYYRKMRGLGQEAFAAKVGISRTHLANLESPGTASSISISVLFDIADALGVPAKVLLDFKEDTLV